MSGIVGIYYRDGQPVDPIDLGRMVDKLAHRGPDGQHIWHHGPVGLGHLMLWTTPESLQEQQPLVARSGDLVLTADARIDNRSELISLLGLNDRPAADISDSDLILAVYEKWGEACPDKLLGDFAFAIWDGREQKLFCARDHLSVKPFYYYLSDQMFVFASELKGLLCLPQVPCQLNETRIADYLANFFNDVTDTFYTDLHRLPPAHKLIVTTEKQDIKPYWKLDPARSIQLNSNEAYAAQFREIFTQAVACRLRSQGELGSLLSGGLDSSAITCVARNLQAENGQAQLATFSAIFDELPQCDERHYINMVLAQNNLQAQFIAGDSYGPLTYLEIIIHYQDEPISAPNLAMYWHMYTSIKQQDIRILLDGSDGDTTVSHGRGYLHELARQGQWLALVTNLKGITKIYDGASSWPYLWYFWRRYGFSPFVGRVPPLSLARRIWRTVRSKRTSRSSSSAIAQPGWLTVMNDELIRQIDLGSRAERFKTQNPALAASEKLGHYLSIMWPLRTAAQEILDKIAAPFGVEARYPFWDKRLVEYCLALPSNQKLDQGWSRIILRRAMDGILPPKIQWRNDKNNFAPSISRGLRYFEQENLADIVFAQAKSAEDYLDLPALQNLYQRFIARDYKDTHQEARDTFVLLRTLALILWLQNQYQPSLKI